MKALDELKEIAKNAPDKATREALVAWMREHVEILEHVLAVDPAELVTAYSADMLLASRRASCLRSIGDAAAKRCDAESEREPDTGIIRSRFRLVVLR